MIAVLIVSLAAVVLVILLAMFPVRLRWFFRGEEREARTRGKSSYKPKWSNKFARDDSYVDEVYDDEEL